MGQNGLNIITDICRYERMLSNMYLVDEEQRNSYQNGNETTLLMFDLHSNLLICIKIDLNLAVFVGSCK